MEFKNVKINSIVVKKQVRTLFNEESLKSLSESIAEKGVLQPILVKKLSDDDYVIIAGERRFLASQLTGLEEIPALVIDNSDDITEIQLIENIQREDLNPVDLANSFKKLRDEGKTIDYITKLTGKSSSYIKEILTILNLSEDEKEKIKSGEAYTNFTRTKSAPAGKSNKTNNLTAEGEKTLTQSIGYSVAYTQNKEPKDQNLEEQGTEDENGQSEEVAPEDQEPNLSPDPKTEDEDDYSLIIPEFPTVEYTDEDGNTVKETLNLTDEDGNPIDIHGSKVNEDDGVIYEQLADLQVKCKGNIKVMRENNTIIIEDIQNLDGLLLCLTKCLN